MSSRHLRRLRRLRGDNPETDLAVEPESERTHADQRQGQPSDGNDDGSNSNDSDNDSDSKGEAAPASRFSAFAALMDEEEEEDDDEEEQEEEQHEQEKPTQQPAEDEQDGVAEALAQSKRKKNRKRRNKKKNKKRQTPVPRLDDDDDDDEEEEEEEEHDGLATKDNGGADEVRQKAGGSLPNNDNDDGDLDALIKSVQEQFGETGEGATSSKPGGQQDPSLSEQSILAVDRRYLNAEKELQRKFKARTSGRATHTFQTPQHRVRGRAVRSAMVTPKPDWPPLGRLGITMTVDKDAQPPPSQPSSSSSSPSSASTATATATAGNARQHVFRFAHSSSYREVQQLFLRAVKGYDPRAFEHILRRHPYHVDTLLQMSQVVRVHGDTAQAGELVERALYCFEANMHPMFNPSKGDCFLDYRYYENRAFFIALFKHISYVSHRGCWRTALECCKLLLALDPDNDPVAAILLIDYFALRSRELSYFLSLCRVWGAKKKLDWLPNFAFSHALAEYMLSQQQNLDADVRSEHASTADSLLQHALMRFPEALALLANRNGANIRSDVINHTFFAKQLSPNRSEKNVRVLLLLFVERNYTLWHPAETMVWLQNNAAAVIAKMESDESAKQETEQLAEWRKQQFPHMPINILRHVIMSGIESTVALLPPAILNGTTFAHDPMPPPDGINEYEQQQQQEEMRQTRRGRHGNGGDGGGDGDALAPWRAFLQSFNPNFNAEATEQDEQRMAEARQQVHVRVREVFDRAREAATSLTRSLANYMQRQGDDGGNGGGDDDGSGDAGGDVEVDPDYMADLQPEELEELLRDNNNNNNNNSNTGARRGRGRNAGGRGQ